MTVSLEFLYQMIIFLTGFTLLGGGLIIFLKYRFRCRQRQHLHMTRCFLQGFSPDNYRAVRNFAQKSPKLALRLLLDLSQNHKLHHDSRNILIEAIRKTGIETSYHRRLQSTNRRKRIDAAIHLAALPCENSRLVLEKALRQEQDLLAKLHLCTALTTIEDDAAIPLLAATLPEAPQWYRTRVNMMLASFGEKFHRYLPALLAREEVEFQSLIVDFAAVYPAADLKQYLLDKAFGPRRDISYRATRTLGIYYCHELSKREFLHHPDPVIRSIVLQALAQIPTWETIEQILPLLADPSSDGHAAAAVTEIIRKEPRYFPRILRLFRRKETPAIQQGLAKILANRIEYLLMHIIIEQDQELREVLKELIRMGNINGLIGFLNKNRTVEIENAIVQILRPLLPELRDEIRREFRLYLQERILAKLGETPLQHPAPVRDPLVEKDKVFRLRLLLPMAFCIVPLIYIILHWNNLHIWSLHTHLVQFVLDFNYFIAYYSLAVNSSYLLLLLCSFLALNHQAKYWHLKKPSFLFRPRILPSISIIAPAYQEEASIVESVNSLLSLHYPNYEVIVVNDGSTDNTLNNLIRHFDLEKVDRFVPKRLQANPVRGIYASKKIPKLLVVDKSNGGKADALNVGINLSQKEFFCGIDADSLLEKDSLTKLASMIIDAPSEPVAIGGNIFPVNGCTVHKGALNSINIPKNHLARFQTIEYLRAFMAGRLGWAQLRSLLIISGAFGLFRKDPIVEVGGYLTSSERYKKDTVGEDMELVVRLNRHMREQKTPYSVLYAFNANCWTEVPESLSILHRQRDRWQRGLIDILYFHRTMQLNPRYGRIGLLSMPYFFLFELFGPFIEIQGYLMVIAAFFLGLLDLKIALLLFITTILLGVLVSVFSLVIVEKENNYFPGPYMTTMLLYAFLENFGVRQMISFWRITGYFSALRQINAWGKMTRQGFQKKTAPPVSSHVN